MNAIYIFIVMFFLRMEKLLVVDLASKYFQFIIPLFISDVYDKTFVWYDGFVKSGCSHW